MLLVLLVEEGQGPHLLLESMVRVPEEGRTMSWVQWRFLIGRRWWRRPGPVVCRDCFIAADGDLRPGGDRHVLPANKEGKWKNRAIQAWD